MSLAKTRNQRPAPAHAKHRNGHHQKQTKGFMKTYWPYLPVAVVVIGGIFAAAAWTLGASGVLLGVGSLVLGGVCLAA